MSAVSRARWNSLVTQSSSCSCTSVSPRATASRMPCCVSATGTVMSPLSRPYAEYSLSPWRARIARRISEEDRPVAADAVHPDRLVEADGREIVGSDEERHHRSGLEQEPAEVAHPAVAVALPAHLGVDPDLLDLHRLRRPGGGLGLEPADPV